MTLDNYYQPIDGDIAFTIVPPKIKFGRGSLNELGYDARALGMSRVALFTGATVVNLPAVATARRRVGQSRDRRCGL